MQKKTVLVTGATGMQGSAVVQACLEQGFHVRALNRDTSSASSQKLAALGAEPVAGDFDDQASLERAMEGCYGVFSLQRPPSPTDRDSEIRSGRNVIQAALAAGIQVFVQTSVARADDQESFVGWNERRWSRSYWNSKSAVIQMVREAGFPFWTILKPSLMMENLLPPKAAYLFPTLESGRLDTAYGPETRLHIVTAADVGKFAAAAFADPSRFHKAEIDLASDALTLAEIAETISKVTGKTVVARNRPPQELLDEGQPPGTVNSQEWAGVEGYNVDIEKTKSLGLPLVHFDEWAQAHADKFVINSPS